MTSFINRFRPGEKGLERILGKLESEIMEIIWCKKNCAIRDVHSALESDRKIAYTTVLTVMSRLFKKGLVSRYKDGQAFIYEPAVSKEELEERTVVDVLKGVFSSDSRMAMTHFVDELAKDEEGLKQLHELIVQRLKDK